MELTKKLGLIKKKDEARLETPIFWSFRERIELWKLAMVFCLCT